MKTTPTRIKTKSLDAYHTDFRIPAHGWNENVYIDYKGAVRAMRFLYMEFTLENIVDGYSYLRTPTPVYHVKIAGIGEVDMKSRYAHAYFPMPYLLSPDGFEGTARTIGDAFNQLTRQNREWQMMDWMAQCFGVETDQLGVECRYSVHDGSAKNILRYVWDGVKPVPVCFNIPNKVYFSEARGFYFSCEQSLPENSFATKDECRWANEVRVVDFDEEPEPQEQRDEKVERVAALYEELTAAQKDEFLRMTGNN